MGPEERKWIQLVWHLHVRPAVCYLLVSSAFLLFLSPSLEGFFEHRQACEAGRAPPQLVTSSPAPPCWGTRGRSEGSLWCWEEAALGAEQELLLFFLCETCSASPGRFVPRRPLPGPARLPAPAPAASSPGCPRTAAAARKGGFYPGKTGFIPAALWGLIPVWCIAHWVGQHHTRLGEINPVSGDAGSWPL